MPALDRAHASLDRAQALDRILDPHRQAEQDETEPVAEVAGEGLIQRPQVERHERVDLVDLVAAIAQVPPHGAGDGRDDDVVDRGVERVPGPLHGRQRHRRPRDAVGHLRLALQGAARVRAGEQELREHAGVSFDRVREALGAIGVQQHLDAFVCERVAASLNEREKSVKGSTVLVLGVSYKRDVDDVRESPALDILRLLESRGARVGYNDPNVPELQLNGTTLQSQDLLPAVRRADVVVIVTDHTAYRYPEIVEAARVVVDTRNATKGIHSPKIIKL